MNPIDLVALFGAGIASFLAPCVLPLIPAYVAMMAGEAADGARSLPRAAGLFVVGFSTVFVGLGVLAGQIGSALTSTQTWLERLGGVIIAIFGLGLLASHRGRALREVRAIRPDRLPSGGALRPFVMGIAFGAAWTPCVGPLLGAALVVAANSSEPVEGAVLLCAYSLGLGVPFVAIALAAASSTRVPGWCRRWSARVEPVGAVLLVSFGVLLATGLYDRLVGRLNILAS